MNAKFCFARQCPQPYLPSLQFPKLAPKSITSDSCVQSLTIFTLRTACLRKQQREAIFPVSWGLNISMNVNSPDLAPAYGHGNYSMTSYPQNPSSKSKQRAASNLPPNSWLSVVVLVTLKKRRKTLFSQSLITKKPALFREFTGLGQALSPAPCLRSGVWTRAEEAGQPQ